MTMKSPAQRPMIHEPQKTACPINIIATLVIIGLRTWRYGPYTTSFLVGSHGANVPWPMRAKMFTHNTNNISPIHTNEPPVIIPVHVVEVIPTQRVS